MRIKEGGGERTKAEGDTRPTPVPGTPMVILERTPAMPASLSSKHLINIYGMTER